MSQFSTFHLYLKVIFLTFLISCSADDLELSKSDSEIERISADSKIYFNDNQETQILKFQNGKSVELFKDNDGFYKWGDMLLTEWQILRLSENNGKSSAISSTSRRWPNLNIYYRFAPSFNRVSLVRSAMTRIRNGGLCINFIELNPSQNADSYIEFRNTSGSNSSNVGRIGGRQLIYINSTAMRGNVIHEIGHSLGLWHEHQSEDRNGSIIVNFQNIFPQFHNQYEIPTNQTTIGNFDFNSVMLYSSNNNFSNGNGPGMTRLNGTPFTGQRNGFSTGDYETIALLHNKDYQRDIRLNNKEFERVLIDYESSQSSQYREEEFYLTFASPLSHPLTVRYIIDETVSNINTHPSGQQTTTTTHLINLPVGQSSYLIETLVTVDEYYDYGEPDGPQYSRNCYLMPACNSSISRR